MLGGIMGFRDSLRGRCLGFWGCSVGLVPSALRMHLEVSTQGFEGGILGPCFGDSTSRLVPRALRMHLEVGTQSFEDARWDYGPVL